MHNKIEKYIHELQHTLIVASCNYDIWWFYKQKNNRSRYLKTMNNYSLFFQTSIHAHFIALVIALYRFFETRRDTHNIKGLIQLLIKNNQIDRPFGQQVKERIKNLNPLCLKISELRSKVFAHRNKEYSIEEIFQEAHVSPNNIKNLLNASKDLLNDITQKWNQTTHAFNLSVNNDINELLTDLELLNKFRSDED